MAAQLFLQKNKHGVAVCRKTAEHVGASHLNLVRRDTSPYSTLPGLLSGTL